MNTAIDDSTLLAYLDGQLEADADYLRVEQALAQDATLRSRLQALVQQGEAIRSAFQAKLQEPVPPHLVAAIMHAPWPPLAQPTQPTQRPAPGHTQPSPWRRLLRHWAGAWRGQRGGGPLAGAGGTGGGSAAGGFGGAGGSGGAGAAPWLWQGLALASLAGLALVLLLGRAGPGVQTPAVPPHWAQLQAPLQDERVRVALQALPSGQVLRLEADTLELMGSFERAPGQHCRELQESRAVAGAVTQTLAVLCQTPDSGWAVAFAASETLPEGGYVTASGAQQAALQAFYDRLGAVEFLPTAEEQARLAAGWQGLAPRP